jgi:aspartyl-tRNA(Asn)/glutamyl-tRNA(Gln) amidotransferase subunit B
MIDAHWLKTIRETLPELPRPKRARFMADYRLSSTDAEVLTASAALADYFETCAAAAGNPKQAANWVMVERSIWGKSSAVADSAGCCN